MEVEVFDERGHGRCAARKGELVCTTPFPSMPVGFWNDPDGREVPRGLLRAVPRRLAPRRLRRADRARRRDHLRPLRRRAESRRRAHRHGRDLPAGRAARRGRREPGRSASSGTATSASCCSCGCATAWRSRPTSKSGSAGASARTPRPRHVPARIVQVTDIPRTKSGKIVELAVRDVVHGRAVRNREALANPEALEQFKELPRTRILITSRSCKRAVPSQKTRD